MSETVLCILIGAIAIGGILTGYGLRVLLDLGMCYFSIRTILSAMCHRPLSETELILALIFIVCYTVTWSANRIAKSNKVVDEVTDKEN